MKLLLYCTKAKPNIVKGLDNKFYISNAFKKEGIDDYKINGKIVAECNFEIEEIKPEKYWHSTEDFDYIYNTGTVYYDDLLKKSCLMDYELDDYLGCEDKGYAVHIKSLHIFDKPRELSEYYKLDSTITLREAINRTKPVYIPINKAPQNMMYCFEDDSNHLQQNILISIKPECLCKILNGEKTIEVRKKVLKEML